MSLTATGPCPVLTAAASLFDPPPAPVVAYRRPRLGFLGLGWIGRSRLAALAESGCADLAALADTAPEAVQAALKLAPGAVVLEGPPERLLDLPLDGVAIATPNARHADQAVAALERGLAVFCQKPLARTAAEARRVIAAARAADRLLAVDLSYRHVRGLPELRRAIRSGELGTLYAMDLTFHNAYGPDKAWFYDLAQSGGGCLMDLGTHLVDLALWMSDAPEVVDVDARLFRQGRPLKAPVVDVEDYAAVRLSFAGGGIARIACSWELHAGCDAVIEFAFYGSRGAAAVRNVNGSFYDFTVERYTGTRRESLARYPDPWGGRALVDFARRLGGGARFDPLAERLAQVSAILDGIYGR
jgi:predicted dehydrogenase